MRLTVVRVKVYWLKDGEPVDADADINVIISNEGNLIISQVRLSDAANYTCVAQNVASRRLSEPAQLIVYGTPTSSMIIHSSQYQICRTSLYATSRSTVQESLIGTIKQYTFKPFFAFSDLTLLVGRQEEHEACKN